ncbi:hypothetical protein [Nocardia niwae]|uniref:Uncharacterized protein n=1 Tax=Nocardia niwae TaxID=626084 RepID=A0ABV2X880_9NOCA
MLVDRFGQLVADAAESDRRLGAHGSPAIGGTCGLLPVAVDGETARSARGARDDAGI